jgi:hypothetical protein
LQNDEMPDFDVCYMKRLAEQEKHPYRKTIAYINANYAVIPSMDCYAFRARNEITGRVVCKTAKHKQLEQIITATWTIQAKPSDYTGCFVDEKKDNPKIFNFFKKWHTSTYRLEFLGIRLVPNEPTMVASGFLNPWTPLQCMPLSFNHDWSYLWPHRCSLKTCGKTTTEGCCAHKSITPENIFKHYVPKHDIVGDEEDLPMGKLSLFLFHIYKVMCNENVDHFFRFLAILSHIIRKPSDRLSVVPCFVGTYGAGKSSIMQSIVENLFGMEAAVFVGGDSTRVTDRFNNLFQNTLLICLDEASFNKKSFNHFKSLMSDRWKVNERKGYDASQAVNRAHFVIVCNALDAPLEPAERRLFILQVLSRYANDPNYFGPLNDCVNDPDVMKQFAYYLMNDEYLIHEMEETLRERAPYSGFKGYLIEQNLSGYKAWWRDCVANRVNCSEYNRDTEKIEERFYWKIHVGALIKHASEHKSLRTDRKIHVNWTGLALALEEMCSFHTDNECFVYFATKTTKVNGLDVTETDFDQIKADWDAYLEYGNWRTAAYQQARKVNQETQEMPRLPEPNPPFKRPRLRIFTEPEPIDPDSMRLYSIGGTLSEWNNGERRNQPDKFYYMGAGEQKWYGCIKDWQKMDTGEDNSCYRLFRYAGTRAPVNGSPVACSSTEDVRSDGIECSSSCGSLTVDFEDATLEGAEWSDPGESQ